MQSILIWGPFCHSHYIKWLQIKWIRTDGVWQISTLCAPEGLISICFRWKNQLTKKWELTEHNVFGIFNFVEIPMAKFDYQKQKQKHAMFVYWFLFDYFNCSHWLRFLCSISFRRTMIDGNRRTKRFSVWMCVVEKRTE